MPPATTSSGPRLAGRLAVPAASASPQTSSRLLGREEERQPAVGVLRGALDVLLRRAPRRRSGPPARSGLVSIFSGLPRPVPWPAGSGRWKILPSCSSALAAQRHPDDVDDLAGAAQRLVVGQAVPALDDLRAGGAEAEDRAAAADVVEAGRGLRERAGRARVDVEDRRRRSRPSRSSRRGSPSAWGSRSRRPRRPRRCPARPSRARRPGRRPRAGCRRTSAGWRASSAVLVVSGVVRTGTTVTVSLSGFQGSEECA